MSLFLGACASSGLVIEPPAVAELTPDAQTRPVQIGTVTDTRVFTTQSFAAPKPSTRGDPNDAAYTQRVFGRRLENNSILGADRFTADPGGVPDLVRKSMAAGLSRATPPYVVVDDPKAPKLDAIIEQFWIRDALQSSSARLIYEAVIRVQGDVPGFESSVVLRAHGSLLGQAEDGVLWRTAMKRTLQQIADQMAEAASPDGLLNPPPAPEAE